jgi:hypothetical protein
LKQGKIRTLEVYMGFLGLCLLFVGIALIINDVTAIPKRGATITAVTGKEAGL